jgi:uncharacterized lipoprotein NlpE involved in copper resistance
MIVNKTIYKLIIGKKSLIIILGIAFVFTLTGCTDKSKDNVTAIDNKPYQSNTDTQSGTSSDTNYGTNSGANDNVPSCH